MTDCINRTFCEYCAINCRPLVWEPHDMYAYVNKIHVDGPRIDVDVYDEDGRHIRTHIPIERCPICGTYLRKEVTR